jgi:hypothetical protein
LRSSIGEASEERLSVGFVSGIVEDGHGLCLMFQRGLSFFYSRFFSSISLRFGRKAHQFTRTRIVEIIWQIYACALIVIKGCALLQSRLRVTHHAILPKHGQGIHRAPIEPTRNHDDSLAVTVHF